MDNSSNQVIGADAGGGAQFNKSSFKADYARCDFDVTHTGNLSMVYDLPRVSHLTGAAGKLVNGWTYTAIFAVRSGQPFSILSGRDNSRTGPPNNDLADQIAADTSRPASADQVQRFFNTSIFMANAIGTYGNMRRNAMTGPGFVGFDMGVVKATARLERVGLQFRFEAFNILNHANFNNPVNTLTNVNFGKLTSAQDPRVLQFALKLAF